MKDKDNNKTSIEGLGVWNDPELEARLVAMLMGELSPFEEDEMKQELEKSPELRLFRDRMLEVQGLISEVNEEEDDASDEEDEGEWKLSPKRKEGLMETFANKEVAVEVDDVIEEDNEEILDDVVSSAGIQWRSFVGVAACLLISLGAFIMMFMRRGEVFVNQEELVSYSPATKLENELTELESDEIASGNVDLRRFERQKQAGFNMDEEDSESFLAVGESLSKKEKGYNYGAVVKKPSSPSSSMSKVIASNTPQIDAVPVPQQSSVEPSLDFGSGTDFGDGWGNVAGFVTLEATRPDGASISSREKGLAMNTRTFRVPPGFGDLLGGSGTGDAFSDSFADDPFADTAGSNDGTMTMKEQLELTGIRFAEGATAEFNKAQGTVTIKNTRNSLEQVEKLVADLHRVKSNKEVTRGDTVNALLSPLGVTKNSELADVAKGGLKRDLSENNSVQKEIARRESQMVESDEAILNGRKAYQNKDYAKAVEHYKSAVDLLPPGPIAAERRRSYTGHLLDGSIALSTQHRRVGKYEEARELLDDVLEADPGNVVARKHLEYLDDPIRTSPTIAYEHTKDVEKVRKNLYKAQSYYDQAQFDEAYLEYQEVLRTDPYNKAARRGMENVDRARMDYYRAAYDQTRAAMLREVDAAWETNVPLQVQKEKPSTEGRKQQITKLDKSSQILSETAIDSNGTTNQQKIRNSLEAITLPLVDFDEQTTVGDAIASLQQRGRELDALDGKKLKMFQNLDADIAEINVGSLQLKNVPMDEVIRQIGQSTGLKFKVTDEGVQLLRATSLTDDELHTRTYRVPQNIIELLGADASTAVGTPSERNASMKALLELAGIKFANDESAVGFSIDRGFLTMRNTPNQIDKLEELLEGLKPKVKQKADFSKELSAAKQTHSTFSLNVSDVSYQLVKAGLLEGGEMPKSEKIRVEEFVNAFDYGDPNVDVASGQKVNCVVEQVAHPFYQQRNLMRIGMKTGALGRSQPLRLTVLLDNSGSMERADRAATVYRAMETLAAQLGPEDEVTLLSFARDARMVAQKVKGDESQKLAEIVKQIPSEGGTNLSLAIQQAYATALQSVEDGAMSRVVLITDGAANLGDSDPEVLAQKIEQMRQSGIAFDACGVGGDGLDDEMLEALTRKGDGRYYFINKSEDADKDFAQKLAGALRPAAQNVKVQVVFNPDRVGKYRLVGFEKHRLEKKDFRNDAVDAAEMAAEECGNALYQVEAKPNGTGSVGTVFVRFRDVSTGKMIERSWDIPYQPNIHNIQNAKPSMQLASLAGMLGELLKYGEQSGVVLDQLRPLYGKLRSEYQSDTEVKDLIRMCEKMSR